MDDKTTGASGPRFSNLPGILFVLAFSAIMLETTLVADRLEAEEMVSESKEKHSRKVLDIERTPRFHCLPGAFRDMLLAAGHSEWSPARINGVLGIALGCWGLPSASR